MQRLVSSLSDCPVPAEMGASPALLRAWISRAANTLLQVKLASTLEPLDAEVARKLRTYANWLESLALVGPTSVVEPATAFHLSSSIREFLLARADGPRAAMDAVPLVGLALASSASTHPAVGFVLGQRAANAIGGLGPPTLVSVSLSCVANLAACRLENAIVLHRGAISLARETDFDALPVAEALDGPGLLLLAQSSAQLGWGLLSGQSALADGALETVDRALRSQDQVMGLSERVRWLARRWVQAAGRLRSRSVRKILVDAGLPETYVSRLTADGIVTLWPQQIEAISAGALRSSQFVLGMPTGAGKTLLAEVAIVKAAVERPDGWICYLAPSRALVSQVERDLGRRLRALDIRIRSVMAGPEESDVLSQEIRQMTSPGTVTVTTPEKLESYQRVAGESFERLVLLVVDEAHLVGEHHRGLLLEQTITRVRVRHPLTKILLLSAVASNMEDFVAWLGGDARSYSTGIRLNRQLFGVAVRLDQPVEVMPEYQRGVQRFRAVRYSGGIVTGVDLDESARQGETTVPVAAPHVFTVEVRERETGKYWIETRTTGAVEHARQLALWFHSSQDTTLVFCPQRISAVAQAKLMSNELGNVPEVATRAMLADTITANVGSGHPLPELVRRGVAYHHANLPSLVQRLIELGVREKYILTLFTTTTLREGMNLPADNVIIAGEKRFDQEANRTDDMPVSDFLNMAGRAGRPNVDTQGVAILVPNQLATAVRVGRKYLLAGPDAVAVRSAMSRLIAAIAHAMPSGDLHQLDQSSQALLLSLYAGGISDSAGLAEVLSNTLLHVQDDFDVAGTASFCDRAFRVLESEIGRGKVELLAKLGFGLEGGIAIESFVSEHLDDLSAQGGAADFGDTRTRDLVTLCLEGCHLIPEVRVRTLASEEFWASGRLRELVLIWISGQSYGDLAAMFGGQDYEESLSSAVELTSEIGRWLPWGLGAIQYTVAMMGRRPHGFVSYLPLYVRFGVPNRVSALLSLMGVFDRRAAIELAAKCPISEPTLADLENWYETLDMQSVLGQDVRVQVLERQRSSRRARVAEVRVIWQGQEPPILGTPCFLRARDSEYDVLALGGPVLGRIADAEEIRSRFPRGVGGVYAVVGVEGGEPNLLVGDLSA